MVTTGEQQAWREVRGGLRPSTVLSVGVSLLAAGPVLATALPGYMIGWWLWLGGLFATGIGLTMCASRLWASRMVPLAGLMYVAHGVALSVAMLGVAEAARIYQMIAVPKVLTLALLAFTERHHHGRHRLIWLATASVLSAAKIGWRTLAQGLPYREFLELGVALVVAVALWIFARGLRRREDQWARRRLAETSASLEDFNRTPR